MHEKEYIIFCDESTKNGPYYSNFYGGAIVKGSQYNQVTARLNRVKQSLNLLGEIKWTKVSENYLRHYEAVMAAFFEEIRNGHVRVRLMFRQNANTVTGLTREDVDKTFFKLYYQFIKHGFALPHCPVHRPGARLRLYFDRFPDSAHKVAEFKTFIQRLESVVRSSGVEIRMEDITEVDSHDHVILQCTDIVLGAMTFRLNNLHQAKAPGESRRGRRTIAKEKLYKKILQEIRMIRPGFNPGISTGIHPPSQRWAEPYFHWSFKPSNTERDNTLTKRGSQQ